jgi:AraC-like DNA-binding protein
MALDFWETRFDLEIWTYYQPRDEFVSRDSVFESWVLIAPESGEFEWETRAPDGEMLSGQAAFGDLVCIAPKMPFQRHVTSRLAYYVLQWHFLDARGQPAEVLWPVGISPVRDTARLSATLENLKSLLGKTDVWSTRRQAHLLEELLHLAWQTRIDPEITDPAMREAALLLRERAGDSFSMDDVSSAFGLGPVQFTRRFRAAHGRNPIEFLTQVRLRNAQKMLIETQLPLDEIAVHCGWASGAYLSHVFKKQFHTTPGAFRKRYRV